MVTAVRRRAALALTVSFLLGAAAGGGLMQVYAQRELARWDRDRTARRVAALTRRLDLTAAQQASVAASHERHHPAMQRKFAEMNERCGQDLVRERDQLDQEIRDVLTPPQRVAFEAMLHEQRDPPPATSVR